MTLEQLASVVLEITPIRVYAENKHTPVFKLIYADALRKQEGYLLTAYIYALSVGIHDGCTCLIAYIKLNPTEKPSLSIDAVMLAKSIYNNANSGKGIFIMQNTKYAVEAKIFNDGRIAAKVRKAEPGEESNCSEMRLFDLAIDVFDDEQAANEYCRAYRKA